MKTNLTYSLRSGRHLPILAAALAGIFAVSSVLATTSFNNADPDDSLWTTEGNWTEGIPGSDWDNNRQALLNLGAGEALIDTNVLDTELITVGDGAGSGDLRMVAGGELTTGNFHVGRGAGQKTANFVMEGGTATATADLWILGRENDGEEGTATMTVTGGTFTTRGLSMGRMSSTSGTANLNVSGGHLNLTGDGGRNLWMNSAGNAIAETNAEINISGDGLVTVGNQVNAGSSSQVGTTTINVSGTGALDAQNHLWLGIAGSGSGTGASSLLLSEDGTVTVAASLDVGHDSQATTTVTVTGGSLDVGQAILLSNKAAGGAPSHNSAGTARLNLSGGQTTANSGIVGSNNNTGNGHISLSGDAVFGITGDIYFTNSANTLTVEGSDVTFNVGGITFEAGLNVVNFVADEGGFSFVNNSGLLQIVNNDAEINIDASEVGLGYYALFGYGSLVGAFTEGTITLADASWTYDLVYDTNELGLNVIPEPGTYAMIFGALALAGAIVLRRRRTA